MFPPPSSLSQVALPRDGVDGVDKLDELIARLQLEAEEERRRSAEDAPAAAGF
jgi:hypothetical protein